MKKEAFISEPIVPESSSFDVSQTVTGEPAFPKKFAWREKEYEALEILNKWKEHGDCHHGSDERYLRKHWYEVKVQDGSIMKIYFLRQKKGRGKFQTRWYLYTIAE